jgi:hypothetical protein
MTAPAHRTAGVFVVGVSAFGDAEDVVDLVGFPGAAREHHLALVAIAFEDSEAQAAPARG